MANSVTHVIVAIVILDLFRHYVFGKKNFPRYLLVIGGIAGLAPDLDIPITWIYRFLTNSTESLHGVFTHSIFFVLLFLGIGAFLYLRTLKKEMVAKSKVHNRRISSVQSSHREFLPSLQNSLFRKEKKWAKIFYVISAGWFMHLILDCLYGGYKTFFWPLQWISTFCPQWGIQTYAADVDAIILVLWLVHEEAHKLIRDYI